MNDRVSFISWSKPLDAFLESGELFFIGTCARTNYADDNTVYIVVSTIKMDLTAVQKDMDNAIKGFVSNVMDVNPSQFRFLFLKPTSNVVTTILLELNGTTVTRSKWNHNYYK